MAKKKTIKNVSPVLESNLVAERIDDTYETKLRSTTTFNKHAIVETEVTMKKPDDLAANYEADEAVVKVNGVEVGRGISGKLNITENGTYDVTTYAEAEVNVKSYKETLLWENPNPTVSFPQTDITEITSRIANNYDALKFILRDNSTAQVGNDKVFMMIRDTSVYSQHIVYPEPISNNYYGRNTFQQTAYLRIFTCSAGGQTKINNYCVPIKIYGVKF